MQTGVMVTKMKVLYREQKSTNVAICRPCSWHYPATDWAGEAAAARCRHSLHDISVEVKQSENHRGNLRVVTDRQSVTGIVREMITRLKLT